jgi:hypothetical protein
MSAIEGTTNTDNNTSITWPPGVVVGAGRETSQTSPATGQIVQGIQVPVTLPNQTTLSFFFPYSLLGTPGAVQALIDQRIAQVQAVTGN